MRTNGTIEIMLNAQNGLNEFGEVVASHGAEWSDAFECLIHRKADDRKAQYAEGERFRRSSWLVLIEGLLNLSELSRVRIFRNGENLGEFDIISAEWIPTMNRTSIIV